MRHPPTAHITSTTERMREDRAAIEWAEDCLPCLHDCRPLGELFVTDEERAIAIRALRTDRRFALPTRDGFLYVQRVEAHRNLTTNLTTAGASPAHS